MMMRNYHFIPALLVISSLSLADTTLIKNINGYTLTNEGVLINFEALKFTQDRIDAIYPQHQRLYLLSTTSLTVKARL